MLKKVIMRAKITNTIHYSFKDNRHKISVIIKDAKIRGMSNSFWKFVVEK